MHPNEVKLTPHNLSELMLLAESLGKEYVQALKEQMTRQGVK